MIASPPAVRQSRNRGGAYGFRVKGLPSAGRHLTPAPADWPLMSIERRIGRPARPRPAGAIEFSAERAAVWLIGGDLIEVQRDPLVVRFTTREPIGMDA